MAGRSAFSFYSQKIQMKKILRLAKSSINKFVAPRSLSEDSRRGEFILNVLLLFSLGLFLAAIIVSILVAIYRPISHGHSSMPILSLIAAFCLFYFLHFLNQRGHYRISAHIFIAFFFLLSLYMGYRWGVDVNASILLYALSVVMAGVLLGARSAFILAGVIALSMGTMGYLENIGNIQVNSYWRAEPWQGSDTVMTAIVFLSVAGVSWLFSREIEKSLGRARLSEKLLAKERDALEETVERRTRELREAQAEKISHLYRFAEFGRLSAGLFHDLMNPLEAVSLNMERAEKEKEENGNLAQAGKYLKQAIFSARKMEEFIGAVRAQLSKKKEEKIFSLRESTEQAIRLLSYKARRAGASISFSATGKFSMFGEEVKWSQVALNLISNAIEATEEAVRRGAKPEEISVSLLEENGRIIFRVADSGVGISPEDRLKIFDPFWSTKAGKEGKGMGLGLSITKNIAEKNFGGEISATSAGGKTIFTVTVPKEKRAE